MKIDKNMKKLIIETKNENVHSGNIKINCDF